MSESPVPKNYLASIAIIGALFFIMGWFTWINGPLISFVRLAFDLTVVDAFLVTFVFYLSYFFWALPASFILDRTGMKKGMALALGIMALGAAAFGQFCMQRWYPGALGGLFTIAAGLALLQTAANPYISILGPIQSAARRIAVMGICNKTAGALAPLLLGTLVLHGMGDIEAKVAVADAVGRDTLLNEFAASIHTPYLLMAGALALLGLGVLLSPLPDMRSEKGHAPQAGARRSLLEFPHVWLGALAIFACIAAEVMAGDAIGTYGSSFGMPLDEVKYFTTYTLLAMLVGYVTGLVAIPRFFSQQQYLAFSAALGVVLTVGTLLTEGYVSVALVAALGFANAMMWPTIFPLGIQGLGRLIDRGSALLVMGICGGALIPQLFAILRERYDFQWVFTLLMVPCYLCVLYFALHGHRVGLSAAGEARAVPDRDGVEAAGRTG